MTRDFTRKTGILRTIAHLAAVAFLIALAALAQTTEQGAAKESIRDRLGGDPVNPAARLFMPAVAYDSGGYTATSIAMADLNGDGKLDVVVGNKCADSGCGSGQGSVGVLLGNGDGTFRAPEVYGSGGSIVQGVAIADVNGDHKPDLIVINRGSNTVGVLLGNGDGTFQPAVLYGSGGMFPTSVAVADVNGDSRPDILVTNACSDSNCDGSVGVLLGSGDGTFKPAVPYNSGGNVAQSVAVADVNHDGKPDLLVVNDCAGTCSKLGGAVAVLLGNGDGTFKTAVSYGSGGIHANTVAVADVNGDGNLDLMVSNFGPNTVGVLPGNGDGTFQPAVVYSSNPGSSAGVVISVAVADVNGDGKPDLVVVNQSVAGAGNNGGAAAVLLGNGDGTFQPAVNYLSGGYQALGVAVGDVNGDGRPDLLLVNECSDNINNGYNCGGPINKETGSIGVLLNNVGAPPTTTSLVSSVNPAATNWTVTYTATVARQSGGLLNGSVLFMNGAAPFFTAALANNQATCNTAYAAKGSYTITAIYSGDLDKEAGSTSAPLTEVIVKPRPSMTQVATSLSPSMVGQPVTFTAIVTSSYGTIPDNELVTFYSGTTVLGKGTTARGAATFTTSSLPARAQSIKATYAGDVNLLQSSNSVLQVVQKYPTATTLTSAPNPSQFGQAVAFTVQITSPGPVPTGKVRFLDGTTSLGFAPLSGGVATLTKSKLAAGTHSITAQYTGDGNSQQSVSALLDQVVK